MRLETEELGEIGVVDASRIAEILDGDAFGKFVVLSAPDGSFVQAACTWAPTARCKAFTKEHDSDPWLLELRSTTNAERARGDVTLERVKAAFLGFLGQDPGWRSAFSWEAADG
jgi:hypothetical protein